MSIYLITGTPGSGKSYYSVYRIKQLLNSNDNFLILTNIAGLNVEDNRLLTLSFTQNGFTNEKQKQYLKQLREYYGLSDEDKIYYFIDEAQQYFSNRLKVDDVIYFFDIHRHYGIDIYLISQNSKKLHRDIIVNAEYEIRAASHSLNPMPGFLYRKELNGEQFGTFRLQKDKKIFELYKSMEAGTVQKKNMKYLYIVLGLVVLISVSGYAFSQSSVISSKSNNVQSSSKVPKKNDMKKEKKQFTSSSSNNQKSSNASDFNPYIYDSVQELNDNVPSLPTPLPHIVEFNKQKDSVLIDQYNATGKFWISINKFLKKYEATLSGYSYLHVPHTRFLILTKNCDAIIFPENKVLPYRKGKDEKKKKNNFEYTQNKISRAAVNGHLHGLSLAQQIIKYGVDGVAEFYGVTRRYLDRRVGDKIDIEENQPMAKPAGKVRKRPDSRSVQPVRSEQPRRSPGRSDS